MDMLGQNNIDYFPAKIATGNAFCNRINERKQLSNGINKGRHAVIYSPRRYGKSSLVNLVAMNLGMPYTVIDLFLAHDDGMINKRIMSGISTIVSELLSPSEKIFKQVQEMFRNFKVNLGVKGYSIESSFSSNTSDNVDQIHEALTILDKIAQNKKSKVIIFFDEFQDIINAESSKAIQGAIRNVAQSTENIVFVFSGSYQHLLVELFDNKSMPLYMLCDKIYLERIFANEYKKHINKLAQNRWQKHIAREVLDKILHFSEAHAFFVNMLCNLLFELPNPPQLDDVNSAWNTCQELEKRRVMSDIQSLSINQQDVLRQIAIYNPTEPTGAKFAKSVLKAGSTIKQCLDILLKKDFVYQVSVEDPQLPHIQIGQYRVLDPVMSIILRKLS